MNQILSSFLLGLAGLGPVISLGLLPSSYQAMCRRPTQAMSYALAAGIQIPLLAALAWLIEGRLVPASIIPVLRPPLLIIILWALQAALGFILRQSPVGGQISFFNQGCLALGAVLSLSLQPQNGLSEVMATALGWSLGFMLSTMALSFILRKIDEKENSPLLSGWPIFLLLLSCFWLAAKGLVSLLP